MRHFQTIGFELVSFLNPNHTADATFPKYSAFSDDLHLCHVVRGRACLKIGDRKIEVTPKRVFFIPPFTTHSVEKFDGIPLEMINFHFHLHCGQGLNIMNEISLPYVFEPDDLNAIHQRLRDWYPYWKSGKEIERLAMVSGLHQLAVNYFNDFSETVPSPRMPDTVMIQVRDQINRTAESKYIADDFARSVSLSTSQMNRRFRIAWGLSPKAYWQKVRQARVQNALRYSTLTLSEIADRFEFSDLFYFSRWFKKMEGISPGAFRKKGHMMH